MPVSQLCYYSSRGAEYCGVCVCVLVCLSTSIFQEQCFHTHTRLTALFPGLPGVSRYQKGKTNLDFTEARDSEWQWHQLGHMQVCTLLPADNHASTPPLRCVCVSLIQ